MFKKIMISATTLTVLSTGLIASDDDISIKDVAKAVEFIINDNKVYQAKAQKELDSNRAEVSKLKLKIAELEKKVSNKDDVQTVNESSKSISKEVIVTEINNNNTESLEETQNIFYVTTNPLFVRQYADVHSKIVGLLKSDKEVSVIKKQNNMAFIGSGWCSMRYLKQIKKEK